MAPFDKKGYKSTTTHMVERYASCVCADGFTMSVQASEFNYCTPRVDGAKRYEEVEVGFPTAVEPLLLDYAEDPSCPTNTIYSYVPVGIVTTVIAKHGGIVEGEVPPGVAPLKASAR